MEAIEKIAQAILHGDALEVRSQIQDLLGSFPALTNVPAPGGTVFRLLAIAASVIELLAERSQQQPPGWAASVAALPQPLFLLQNAQKMRRLRLLCEQQTPDVFRKRRLFAPPNYLEFA